MIVCIIILLIAVVIIFRVDSNAKQLSPQPKPIYPSFSDEDVYMIAKRMEERWKLANKEAVEEFEQNRKKYVAMYVDQAITKYGSKEAAYKAMCPRDDYRICLRDVRLTKEEEIESYRFNKCRQEIIDELKKGI